MEYEILRDLFKCKFHDGGKVSEHVLKMISLIESFENFIVNFNMNNMKVGLPELHNRLKTYESSTAKVKFVLMVSSSAKSSKWKNKQQQKKKASKDDVLKPKSGGAKKKSKISNDECLFCHEKGHWKGDCPKFKAQGAESGSSGSK
ncbi:uncharacterized protein LOC121779077 [Salvia splendens]|uniref:uncharacterized protein LOC121779077 n=1 Tax=Salvia splendens TaxID=180675 RepID=UPI001C251E28|nr:uncharacterized protein LOC121779077 [Salvia splendens]